MAKPKKNYESYLLISPVLKYQDYIVTPGKRVNLIDGMYIEYTTVEVRVRRDDVSDVDGWKIDIMGLNGLKLLTLPFCVLDAKTEFNKSWDFLESFRGHSLSEYSRKIRVNLHKWGGSGLDYESINGWDSKCASQEPPLLVDHVLGWFTGYEGLYTRDAGVPDPKFVRYQKGSQELTVYDDLYPNAGKSASMENRMSSIAGVEFYDNRGSSQRRFAAPHFFYHTLTDYAEDYSISLASTSDYLRTKECGSRRAVVMNSNFMQIHSHSTEISKHIIRDGKLLKKEAECLLSPIVSWVPCRELETMDSTGIRLCAKMHNAHV